MVLEVFFSWVYEKGKLNWKRFIINFSFIFVKDVKYLLVVFKFKSVCCLGLIIRFVGVIVYLKYF